jgi:hypothetical protein
MKEMISAFSLMSEEDQREGLELIHKLFYGPVPQTTTEPVIDISSHPAWNT